MKSLAGIGAPLFALCWFGVAWAIAWARRRHHARREAPGRA
ncbi:hypothetical protein [Zavarzinia compransoris]|nr:hypothetical protein [Zavarzinia compransoris]TDP44299.1 hypothetical protein DES42_10764 [Zavarzinia compransoris]